MIDSSKIVRTANTPIPVTRSVRVHDVRAITSMPAGKMVPIAAIPLLREDQMNTSRFRLNFDMMETAEILMNAVNVRVMAYFIPNLAFKRFNGMDDLNRSYEGVPYEEGKPVVPYFKTMTKGAHGAEKILYHLGKHAKPGTVINSAYIEAYNTLWNYRAKNRSPDLTERNIDDTSLAPAFWYHPDFDHIVPDFDDAAMEGEVALNVVNSKMPVRGIGWASGSPANTTFKTTGGLNYTGPALNGSGVGFASTVAGAAGVPAIFAEMEENGITVSLANIELARKTQAFAKLRQQYDGHSDEYIIDLLMSGISVPEQMWRYPMLLSDQSTVFGMAKRYSTDSGALTESVVSGATSIDLILNVPRAPTGGVIMIVAEVTPEQMFERQADPYLHTVASSMLPEYLRDELDPQKVDVVTCGRIDTDHQSPQALFGYEPMNAKWNNAAPNIGGKFYRPNVDAGFNEDRQRIWAVETKNPTLSTDFYLCTNMHTKPFVVTNQDPFEVVIRGEGVITGNTVFGGHLVEGTGAYDAVKAKAPNDRVTLPTP